MELASGEARLGIDLVSGALTRLGLADFHQPLLEGGAMPFDVALPLPDELPHRLRSVAGQRTTNVEQVGDEWRLRFDRLRSERGTFDVDATLVVRPQAGGAFAMSLEIINRTPHVIPQVLFPNLVGFAATGDPKHEQLHLGRAVKQPHVWMQSPDGAAAFYDLYRRWYFVYGMQEWCLKWFRLGNTRRGLSVFSKDLGVPLQGLYVEREKRSPRLNVSWAHYPHVPPGGRWASPEIVVQPHHGDWRIGIEAYRAHCARHLPTAAPPKYLRDSLGARSLYFSTYLYDNEPNLRFRDLPTVARDALSHGLKELVCWFLFDGYFELPMKPNPKLGTERELAGAVAECRAMGVNVVAFVSCRSLKTRGAPPRWFEVDEHGNRRTQAWSYSLDFVPVFNPPYCNRDESAFACPGSADYRAAFSAACAGLRRLGFSSICFDQLFSDRLCYSRNHGHAPQELLAPLYETVRRVLAEGRSVDPEATFSGEFFNDVSQTFQHYNWDWITGANSLDDLEPFRAAFPRYRIGLLVDRSRRWLLEGFVRGLFLNFLPDGGEGLIEADAEFSALAKRLAVERKRYAKFFEEGEYHGARLLGDGPELAGLYRLDSRWMLVVVNATEREVRLRPGGHPAVSLAVPASLLAPFDFRIFVWTEGREGEGVA